MSVGRLGLLLRFGLDSLCQRLGRKLELFQQSP